MKTGQNCSKKRKHLKVVCLHKCLTLISFFEFRIQTVSRTIDETESLQKFWHSQAV